RTLVVVVVVEVAPNLTRRKAVGVNVRVDVPVLQGFEKSVEAVLARGESLAGKRQDLRGGDGPVHSPGRARAYRSVWRRRRGAIVSRLAQPDRDPAGGVLLSEVEMGLVHELRANDRRAGGV